MKTLDVQHLIEEQLRLTSAADDVFGLTPADQAIADVRRTAVKTMRDAVGAFNRTNPEATSAEITAVLDPIWVAEQGVLSRLPAPESPTPREVSQAKLAIYSQIQDLVPDDIPSTETLAVAVAQVAAAGK